MLAWTFLQFYVNIRMNFSYIFSREMHELHIYMYAFMGLHFTCTIKRLWN